eukprot:TRINITY_DN11304_c0_g2_i1.p1 TRINITY_DN11304_c0_g2~~TRINITY_DN11304_c0_g2_i1.p1  ORF type:complete len:128 (+),score=0.05 TRINITY_DN11304_c0_g2_i1:29-412(+)
MLWFVAIGIGSVCNARNIISLIDGRDGIVKRLQWCFLQFFPLKFIAFALLSDGSTISGLRNVLAVRHLVFTGASKLGFCDPFFDELLASCVHSGQKKVFFIFVMDVDSGGRVGNIIKLIGGREYTLQ